MDDKYFNLANHAHNNKLPTNKDKDKDPRKQNQNPFQSKQSGSPLKSVESESHQNELQQKRIS